MKKHITNILIVVFCILSIFLSYIHFFPANDVYKQNLKMNYKKQWFSPFTYETLRGKYSTPSELDEVNETISNIEYTLGFHGNMSDFNRPDIYRDKLINYSPNKDFYSVFSDLKVIKFSKILNSGYLWFSYSYFAYTDGREVGCSDFLACAKLKKINNKWVAVDFSVPI